MEASGQFEVNLQPLASFAEGSEGIRLGRMSIEKTFQGDLVATSRGEMLTARTGVEGSAGYVAIEQVDGTLQGKSGTFVLQHSGIMARGENRLLLEVVPDSGTGDLAGIAGNMKLRIEDGAHYYQFEYELG